ncbi:hypothetical protein DFJ58DRAFT_913528 [Suillus subalutaceus]|uniref:uncharacterized protein n=1 Tax=Suillus subalutaceus TaxID=48586 RepID=UPI001B85F91D|nr:uncharacterized protein DFJ58DRAFT_913528 [Suillus subalutaceus]KAG1856952.1 hypothetical protein DFJ58DRAFT_913528 [Suillus subalutaceus]
MEPLVVGLVLLSSSRVSYLRWQLGYKLTVEDFSWALMGCRCPTLRMCVISSFDLLTNANGAAVASHSQECPGHVLLSHGPLLSVPPSFVLYHQCNSALSFCHLLSTDSCARCFRCPSVTHAVHLIYGSKANVVCDLETDEALMFIDIDAMPESEE